MLCLSRQPGESIIIGDRNTVMLQMTPEEVDHLRGQIDSRHSWIVARVLTGWEKRHPIEITINEVRQGPKVRVGIECPKHVNVWRKELGERE